MLIRFLKPPIMAIILQKGSLRDEFKTKQTETSPTAGNFLLVLHGLVNWEPCTKAKRFTQANVAWEHKARKCTTKGGWMERKNLVCSRRKARKRSQKEEQRQQDNLEE